jgi:RNA polymerase sigma-70 factor (ECF subfamily)
MSPGDRGRPLRLSAVSDSPVRLEELLAEVARGARDAYEVLYTRVSAAVYGMVVRVLRDRAQSEEVAQEALLQVWREANRFDEKQGSAMAWIMTIAHRRAVDRVRSEESASKRTQRLAARDVETSFDSVSEDVELQLEREAVRKCLATLTVLQRDAVNLAYYSGHTYPEVANQLGVPLGTVKTRIRDGLIRLRDCLGVTA